MPIEDIPTVNRPEDDFYGRVVQLYLGERPILRFAKDFIHDSHSIVLWEVLDLAGVHYRTTSGILTSRAVPSLEGEQYRVVGMGISMLIEEGIIEISGYSGDYGIGPNLEHLIEISKLEPGQVLVYAENRIENGVVSDFRVKSS